MEMFCQHLLRGYKIFSSRILSICSRMHMPAWHRPTNQAKRVVVIDASKNMNFGDSASCQTGFGNATAGRRVWLSDPVSGVMEYIHRARQPHPSCVWQTLCAAKFKTVTQNKFLKSETQSVQSDKSTTQTGFV